MLCSEPSSVVVYTLTGSGYVGFYDSSATANGDLYFVARSLRPVAVAYDPVDKVKYHHRSLSMPTIDKEYNLVFIWATQDAMYRRMILTPTRAR